MKKFIFLLAIVLFASFSFLSAQTFAFKDAPNSKQTELNTTQVFETEQVEATPQSELFFQELSVKEEKETTRPAATRAELELGFCGGIVNANYGTTLATAGTHYISGRVAFTAEHMSNYVGMVLHSIETGIGTTANMGNLTSYRVWIKKTDNGAIEYEQDVLAQVTTSTSVTWKTFALTTPYTITSGSLVIGFTAGFTTTAASQGRYPLPTETVNAPYPRNSYGFLLSTNANGHGAGAAFGSPLQDRALHIWGHVTGTLPNSNLSAADVALGASTAHTILGDPLTFTAIVFNAGATAQNNYSVQFLQQPSNTVLATVPVTTSIAPGGIAKILTTFPATAIGDFAVKAKVVLTGDQNSADDITPYTAADYVYPMAPLTFCDKSAFNGGGYGAGLVGSTAVGYTAANSGPYVGKKLTAIRVGLGAPYTTYTNCTVWIASTLATTQTYIYTQSFTPTNDGWVTVVLNTPYELTSAQTYIGWTGTTSTTTQFTVTNNPPAVLDGGRIKNGTSAWTTVSAAFGNTYNSALIGVIVSPPPCPAVTNLNAAFIGDNVVLTWGAAAGNPTGYEIKFRGNVLTTVPAGTTIYTHNNVPKGQHEYCVTALHGAEECVLQPVCKTVTKGDVCNLTVVMRGTSTTSWNATTGGIEVIADGYSYGILRGSGATTVTHNLILPEGPVNFVWTTGGTPAQQSFDVINVCGEVVYSRAAGSLSAGISPLAFSVTHGCPPCEKLQYLSLDVKNNCDAELTFSEAKPPFDGWAKHCVSDAVSGGLGFSSGTVPINTAVAMRFTPADLAAQNIKSGRKITKVALGFWENMDNVNSVTLTIWEGGGPGVANQGAIVYTQTITAFSSYYRQMVEFTLNTPFVIDATKELRIGYQIQIAALNVYPMGRDAGPTVAGKGALIDNGGWADISTLGSFNWNWSIKAYVEPISWTPDPVLVNIYRDGTLIEDNYLGTTYTDVRTNFDVTQPHTWAVAKVCNATRESCKVYASADACKKDVAYDCPNEKPVGAGSVGVRINPIDGFNDWSYTQQIYDAAEIGLGGPGILGKISFQYIFPQPLEFSKVDIYLGNTTTTTFSSNTAWVALANLTKVYSGSISASNGWVTIEFDNVFNYTGNGIVVALNKMSPEYLDFNQNFWQATGSLNNKTIYVTSLSTTAPYNPASPGTGTRVANRANAKFHFCGKLYTLNPNDIYGAGVTVTLNPSGGIPEGQNGTVNFTLSNPCYRIIDVKIGGVSMGPITSYTFTNVTAPLPMIEVITSNTYNITATAGANGTISPAGNNMPFNTCENHTFTFTPDPCYMVDVVTVNGTPVTPTTPTSHTFSNLTENKTIHVTFKIITHTIQATAGPNGTISPSHPTPITVNQCTNHTFTITPNACYEVDVFTVNGTPTALTPGGTPGTFTYTITGINANYVINVTFKNIKHNIVATAGTNGTISPAGTTAVNECANQTYTFTPDACYMIDQVTVNGAPVTITGNTYTFNSVSAPATIHVTFKYITHIITATAGPNGTINPVGTATVNQCSNHTYTITPNPCFMVDVVTVNGVPVSIPAAGGTYTFSNVSASHTINATFKYITHNIVASAGFGGTISPSGTQVVNQCSTHTFTFTPNFGFHILQVLVNGIPNAEAVTNGYHTFANINANHTISVTFELNCYGLNPDNELGTGVVFAMNPPDCVYHGYDVTFTFKPLGCTELVNVWIDGFGDLGAIPSFTIHNVIGNLPKIKITEYVQEFDIVSTINNPAMGTIDPPAGTYTATCGENVTYNFLPNTGYRVKTVKVNGVTNQAAIAAGYHTFNSVVANHTIYVEFEAIPIYIIQFGPNTTQGKVYPTLDGPTVLYYKEYYEGSNVQFTIEPGDGYEIDKVHVDGVVTIPQNTATYTFTNIQINHTIFATFKPITHIITATATAGGTITPAGAVSVNHGASKTFYAVPNTGYKLVGIYMNGSSNAADTTGVYTVNNVVADSAIHAVFAIKTYKITATKEGNGTINPAGVIDVNHGSSKTFTFTPEEGYKVDKVFINTLENPAAAQAGTYTFTDIDQDHTIKVTFTRQMLKITANAGINGTVQPHGIDYVEYWAHSEIYVFNPAQGYHIKEVLVDNVNNPLAIQNGEHRFLNVTTDHTLLVFFAKDNYTINAMTTAGGAITPAGLNTVPAGSNKTFFFEPFEGYKLTQVIINGINNPDAVAAGSYTFYNIYDDWSITAKFEKITYTVTLPTAAGIVAAPVGGSNSPVAYGGSYNFVVDLLAAYTQSKLIVKANNIVINPVAGVYTITNIMADQVVTVTGIEKNVYKVSAIANPGGMILPAGVFDVTHGESKTFEMVPDKDYIVKSVVVNGVNEGAVSSYTFYNVTADGVVEVFFKYDPLGLGDPDAPTIHIFSNKNVVTISNENLVPVKQVEIMDMYGRVVWQGQATDAKTEITLNVATGIYSVRVATEDGFTVTKVSITK